MTKHDFSLLFDRMLKQMRHQAQTCIEKDIPDTYEFEIHGAGYSGKIADWTETINILYINNSLFWQVIDLAIIRVSSDVMTVFVRASGHPPCEYAKTWYYDRGTGPFKIMHTHL